MSRIYELVDKLCPNGVPYIELGKLASIRNGFSYKADKDRSRRYKVSRIETISKGGFDLDRVATVDEIDASYRLQVGDILFSHINSLPYLGNCAYYTNEVGELYHGMNLLDIRCISDEIMPRYLWYYMHTYRWWLYIYRDAKRAINQCSISTSDMKRWLVPLPSIKMQQEIVRILDAFQELDETLGGELAARERQFGYFRLFGGFCGRDSGIGPAQRAKTTIWN